MPRDSLLLFALSVVASHTLTAQDPVSRPLAAASVVLTARGYIYDSVAGHPIGGANVQLAGADSLTAGRRYAAFSDSAGRFAVPSVVPGRYRVGFFDPALDTLGIQSNGQPIDIEGPNLTIALAVPSARTLGMAFCGQAFANRPEFTLLYGRVTDAESDSAALGASVAISWAEIRSDSVGARVVDRSTSVSVRQGGTYAACGLPGGQPLTIRAVRGADSSGAVPIRISRGGLRHLTLTVARNGMVARLSGHVFDSVHLPVSGARVSWSSGSMTREAIADGGGSFVLDSLPTGTSSLTVRAIGYSPRDAIFQLAASKVNTLDIVLDKVITLPTVVSTADARLQQFFEDKTKTPFQAFFIQPPHPLDYPPQSTICQLVMGLPGVGNACNGGPMNIKHAGFCRDAHGFVLNGKPWAGSFEDVEPTTILGIEYFPRNIPAQYDGLVRSMKLCPIVVWTK